jgi:leucyl aminopeptidase
MAAMRVVPVAEAPVGIAVDALAIAVSAGEVLNGSALEVDRALGGMIGEVLTSSEFKGDLHEVLPLHTQGRIAARRVILYGLGPSADLDGQRLRSAHHQLLRSARKHGYRRIAILRTDPLGVETLQAVVEGSVMGTFERRSHQTSEPERGDVDELLLIGFGDGRQREVDAARESGEATNRARELSNMPPNELTPSGLADEATRIAQRHGLELEVLGPSELRASGYNLLLGVAAGSAQAPRMIRLRHHGAQPDGGTVLSMVGKGITFDTGGIALKEQVGMSKMKADMAGAAAVLSAIDAIAARKLPLEVMAVVAAAENMPGPTAMRPGDVVVSAAGKTVEVLNPDAEGRLVLADAITYALRSGATHIVDLATLTGAATIAIGHAATAAVSNDDAFWLLVEEAARRAGDRVWRLPILADYRVLLRSKVADLRNSEYGEAGSILGGMFIAEFVGGKPWAHLDIAASSWNTNADLTTVHGGPSGAGTRICIELAELMAGAAR